MVVESLDFRPKNKEIEHLMDRLMQWPVVEVDPKLAQSFSRYNKIRYMSRNKNIFIRKGLIGVPHRVVIKKKKDGWFDISFRI